MPKGSWREFEDISKKDDLDLLKKVPEMGDRAVRVQRMRGGKGGKTVTIISGLDLNDFEAKKLLKKLKIQCGTGGTFKGENIELQGDQIQPSIEVLQKEGFKPKQSGG